jgi:thymidylate synthase (FAD)
LSSVRLVWATPNGEQLVADMARVSNPANQGMPPGKLLAYCVRNQHWSIFEMVNAVFEIETTRDIARQILRHRSFSFQEFSQRYADVGVLPEAPLREARMQDTKNRQNSIETDEVETLAWWYGIQNDLRTAAEDVYSQALVRGIAKEVARSVLPEGLTTSRMYMNGTLRSWMHYCKLRSGNGTQKEHAEIAQAISTEMQQIYPESWKALLEN